MPTPPYLSAADLKELSRAVPQAPCPPCCAYVRAPGWESLPASFDPAGFRLLGSLRNPDYDAPEVLTEYHPDGSSFWSPNAPIAPRFFPYNQSEVWACVSCARPFLRYTEHGGYYHEDRIRELNTTLVVDAHIP